MKKVDRSSELQWKLLIVKSQRIEIKFLCKRNFTMKGTEKSEKIERWNYNTCIVRLYSTINVILQIIVQYNNHNV